MDSNSPQTLEQSVRQYSGGQYTMQNGMAKIENPPNTNPMPPGGPAPAEFEVAPNAKTA